MTGLFDALWFGGFGYAAGAYLLGGVAAWRAFVGGLLFALGILTWAFIVAAWHRWSSST